MSVSVTVMDLDSVIMRCIDGIWLSYDSNGNGELTKEETRRFIFDVLREMSEDFQFSQEDFERCFKEFDTDGSGTIEKAEMLVFIKLVAGLEKT